MKFSYCILDFRAILIKLLIKIVSTRSFNRKYFVPPIIDMITLGLEIFQASSKILSIVSTGVSKANRAN